MLSGSRPGASYFWPLKGPFRQIFLGLFIVCSCPQVTTTTFQHSRPCSLTIPAPLFYIESKVREIPFAFRSIRCCLERLTRQLLTQFEFKQILPNLQNPSSKQRLLNHHSRHTPNCLCIFKAQHDGPNPDPPRCPYIQTQPW